MYEILVNVRANMVCDNFYPSGSTQMKTTRARSVNYKLFRKRKITVAVRTSVKPRRQKRVTTLLTMKRKIWTCINEFSTSFIARPVGY